ncbi:MAG: hypothetical protein FJ030_05170 [Chloroflexi bacterium]|nr:hypothetical protein [Chloroflexota bacterium]
MQRIASPQTMVFHLIQRADMALTSRTADALHHLLLRWWQAKQLKRSIIEYGIVALTGLSAGALYSLVTTWLM